jgi:hypothetical protein
VEPIVTYPYLVVSHGETDMKPVRSTLDGVTREALPTEPVGDDVPTVDAYYIRAVSALHSGEATSRDLIALTHLRSADHLVSVSEIDPTGRHLDALILALLGDR